MSAALALCLVAVAPARWTVAAPGERIAALAASPDGAWLTMRLVGEAGDRLAVAPTGDPTACQTLLAVAGQLSDPVWLPPRGLAVAAADGLRLWDDPHAPPLHFAFECLPGPLAAAADQRKLAVPLVSGAVRCLDVDEPRGWTDLRPDFAVAALLLDPSGDTCLTAGAGGELVLWRLDTGGRLASSGTARLRRLALLDSRGELLGLAEAGLVRLRWPDLALLGQRAAEGAALAVSNDGAAVATAGAGGVCLWRDGLVRRISDQPADAVAFAGEVLLAASGRELWRLDSGIGGAVLESDLGDHD